MVFSSILFIFIYLAAVLAIYYICPLKIRNIFLFIANLIFYGWGEPVYVLIMIFSTLVDYIHGMLVEKYRSNDRLAKKFVVSSVVINLSLLMFFKYFDFFAVNLARIPGLDFIKPLGIPLPIGISFYTFQTMSYTIDIYRGEAKAQKNIINFGSYVSLFPQLIAGPIVRYKDIADQLQQREHSVDKFASGVERFIVGLGKKVLLANSIGMLWDVYKAVPAGELTVAGAWLGAIAYTFQIYFDFSGYSDMAVGLGRMFGFEFLENFNYPYISKSISEFWRRWHISLGTWFREYVYIPMGGNRCKKYRNFFNILVVWMLTGMWHGANWNFIIWGLYYAVLLMVEKAFLLKWLEKAPGFVAHIYTMFFVIVGWAIFANESLTSCVTYIGSMFGIGSAGLISDSVLYYLRNYGVTLIILCVACTPLAKTVFSKIPERTRNLAIPALILICLVLSTAYLVDATYNPFLYFRF